MLTLHCVHVTLEILIAILALSCSLCVIYLAMYKIRNDLVKVYNHMLIMSATVDALYSAGNLMFIPVRKSKRECF